MVSSPMVSHPIAQPDKPGRRSEQSDRERDDPEIRHTSIPSGCPPPSILWAICQPAGAGFARHAFMHGCIAAREAPSCNTARSAGFARDYPLMPTEIACGCNLDEVVRFK